ncbi:MAG: hypothetical protein Q9225_003946 [Loekoesia sp. 1 TL-2023]
MFIIYADSKGSNVTLSPRAGEGHAPPKFTQGTQAFLLEGSGIANGKMTANVRCSSCLKWQDSTLDVTSTQSNWIWAAKDGSPMSSDSQGANIEMHDSNGQLTFDLTRARSGNSLNPFIAQAATTAATGASPSTTAASSESDESDSSDSGSAYGSGSSGDSGSQEESPSSKLRNILIAHGVIMSLAWVIFFPLGAILIRTISARNVIHIHSITQSFAYVLAVTGMGLGVYVAVNPESVIDQYHPVIGLVVIGLATIQPILGSIHHRIYRTKRQRTWWAVAHVTLGRLVVTLAIINGGLGLRMAENTRAGEIVYGVVAGVIWLVWMAIAVRAEAKKYRARGLVDGEKHINGNDKS